MYPREYIFYYNVQNIISFYFRVYLSITYNSTNAFVKIYVVSFLHSEL